MSVAAECLRPDTLSAWAASAAVGPSQALALQRFLILATRDWTAAGFDAPATGVALDDTSAAAAVSRMNTFVSAVTSRVDSAVEAKTLCADGHATDPADTAASVELLWAGALAALVQLLPPLAQPELAGAPGAMKVALRRAAAAMRKALYEGLLTEEEASYHLRPLLAALHPTVAVARPTGSHLSHLHLLARCDGVSAKTSADGGKRAAESAFVEEPFMQWATSDQATVATLEAVHAAAAPTAAARSSKDSEETELLAQPGVDLTRIERQQALLNLACPDMALSDAVQAYLATRNASAPSAADFGAPLLDAARVAACLMNCKEMNSGVPATAKVGAFDTMSKVAHSCNPNCTFNGASALMPLRQIRAGEELSFSYVAMLDTAFRGTESRRRCIMERRGFYCECPRCTDPDPSTHGRAAPCATCGAPAFPMRAEAPARASASGPYWCCIRCGGRMAPGEMAPAVAAEERLERALTALAADLDRCGAPIADLAAGTALSAPPKNLFESLRQGLMDVLQKLGRFHWLYVYGCLQAARYFCLLAALPSSTAPTRDAASSSAVAFGVHFCVGAQRQRLHRSAAAAVAAVLTDVGVLALRRAWTGPRRVEAALLIETARRWCPSWVRDSAVLQEYLHLAKDAPRLIYERLQVKQHGMVGASLPDPGRCVQLVAASTLGEEAAAFAEWEQHLAARVSAYLQQQQHQGRQGSAVDGAVGSSDAAQALVRRLMEAQQQQRR